LIIGQVNKSQVAAAAAVVNLLIHHVPKKPSPKTLDGSNFVKS